MLGCLPRVKKGQCGTVASCITVISLKSICSFVKLLNRRACGDSMEMGEIVELFKVIFL